MVNLYEPSADEHEVEITENRLTKYRLDDLEPEQMYRLSIWATTKVGRGDEYQIEEKTLPGGGQYLLRRGRSTRNTVELFMHRGKYEY